jgi:hypothetical protein
MQETRTYFEHIPMGEIETLLGQQTGDQSSLSLTREPWEKPADMSNGDILEILEQNSKWWEHAAVACENLAPRLASGEKEEWLLLCAVYRERAGIHARLVEQLRCKSDGAHG